MPKVIDIRIQTTADLKGVAEIQRALQGLAQAQTQANRGGGGGASTALRDVGQAAAQSEKDVLRYASAMASAQKATGDTAGSVETMRHALGQMTPGTVEAHQATTKLAQAQSALQKELQGGATFAQQFSQSMVSGLTAIIGPAAAAGAAIAAIGKTGELLQLGAQAEQTRVRFDGLATAAGTTGKALIQALRSASAGTISDLNLELAANRAQLLGVADSAEKFSTLMEIARARAQDMGISTTQAFNDLITGLGRGSALILDNLGITVSVTEANKAYAAQIGKTVAQLSEAEQKQALINAVLEQGTASLEAAGGAAETTASKLERMNAAGDNIKAGFGATLANELGPSIDLLGQLGGLAASAGDDAQHGAEGAQEFGRAMAEASGPVGQILGAVRQLSTDINTLTGNTAASTAEARQAEVSARALAAQRQGERNASIDASSAAEQVAIADAHAAIAAQQAAAASYALAQQRAGERGETESAMSATEAAAAASLMDAAAKEEEAAKTELMRLKTEEAVTAFMALHPNIDAAGVSALVTAGKIDPLIAQLIMARIKADEARAALAAFAAMANIKVSAGANFAERHGGAEGGGALTPAAREAAARQQRLNAQIAAAKKKSDADAARNEQILATGTHQQKLAQLRSEYDLAVRQHGAESAEAIKAQTKVIQAEQQAARAGGGRGGRGGGGGGGGSARVSEAEKTVNRLEDIERQGGQKIADINEQTQEKIAAIEQKYAEKRAQQQRELMDEIARTNASTRFDQELNDFDKFQKDLSDEQKAALADREKAEQEYNAKVAQYQEEARQMAASGDAQEADDVLAARTKQAEREKEIAERAAEAKRNAGKKARGAVDAEAQQARDAAKAQADTEIAIAHAKAQERAGAEQSEKDAVIAQAEEQKQKVIEAAEESARKVKGASDGQKATVIQNLRDQAAAVKAWADTVVDESKRASDAMAGVTGPPAAGGGGGGEGGAPTGGGTTGGGNPTGNGSRDIRAGGKRSGTGGGGSVQDAIDTLNDAAEIIKVIKPFVAANKGAVKLLNEYSLTVKSAVSVLTQISDLRQRLVAPAPVIDLRQIQALANEVVAVLHVVLNTINPAVNAKVRVLAKYLETEKSAVDILNTVVELRKALSAPTPPISATYVMQLIAESNAVVSLILSQLIPLKQREVDGLKTYADAAGAAIGIISDLADLRKDLSDQKDVSPLNWKLIQGLAQRAADLTRLVQSQLVPLSQQQAEGFEAYATSAGAAVSILKDAADLRKELSDQKDVSPFNMALIKGLAARAKEITQIVLSQVVPLTEEQIDAFQRYDDAAGAAVSILKDTADLRKELSETTTGAIDPQVVQRLADDAHRITEIVIRQMVPVSEETADAAQRFADTEGSAVEVLKNVLELPAKIFTDYQSPTDAQINAVVKDANRIVQRVAAAAAVYDTKGLDAAKAFGEASGSVLSAFKDQLLFAQALNSGDFIVDDRKLDIFEQGMLKTIVVAGRLGAQATAIPAGNIAALQAVAAANTASYESMVKLAAVPFGNVPAATNAYAGTGGGAMSAYFNNTFVLPAGSTQQQAKEIMGIIQQQLSGRR